MQQEIRALEVREKLVPEPDSLARSLDEPGDVCNGQLPRPVGRVDRAEHGRKRRERIVGDLRLRIRDPRQQRRLPGVRQSDERRVGEQLEAKLQRCLLAGQPRLCKARRPPGRRREAFVAATGDPASRCDDPRGRRREIGDQLRILVEDLRADRHAHLDRLPGGAVLQCAAAGLAVPRLEPATRAKRLAHAAIRTVMAAVAYVF